MQIELIKPTPQSIKEAVDKFLKSDEYEGGRNTTAALKLAFRTFPTNTDIPSVLIKTSALNDLYRTNIFATPELAKHITALNIDPKVHVGDLAIVAEIAKFEIREKTKTFYSFATKYCHWHNQAEYPIFDSRVHNSLVAYKKQDGFAEFKEEDLRHYPSFKEIINMFIDFYSLSGVSYKELDKFLWLNDREKAYDIDVIREGLPNAYKSWSIDEDEKLIRLYQEGTTKIKDLASIFQRNDGAIRSRLKKLIAY
jgi:hypothetical protein